MNGVGHAHLLKVYTKLRHYRAKMLQTTPCHVNSEEKERTTKLPLKKIEEIQIG